MMRRFAAILLLLLAPTAEAETVVAGLSQNRIAITASFDGSDLLVFGAVKREEPIPQGPVLQVIVTVEGPSAPIVVRRKSRVFGIWINTSSVEIDRAPSFYAVATTAPLAAILSPAQDVLHSISIDRAIRPVGAPIAAEEIRHFTDALVRIRTGDELFSQAESAVRLTEDTLFFTQFNLPANLVEGNYKVRIFLTRDQKVVDVYESRIFVRKVGLGRWLFKLAHEQALIYGLLSVLLAVAIGWVASAAFRFIRS